jgi:hypothetical protein
MASSILRSPLGSTDGPDPRAGRILGASGAGRLDGVVVADTPRTLGSGGDWADPESREKQDTPQERWLKKAKQITGLHHRGSATARSSDELLCVLYNEVRSLYGTGTPAVRVKLAHVLLNHDEVYLAGGRRPDVHDASDAPIPKKLSQQDQEILAEMRISISTAQAERENGQDPTNGALYFLINEDPLAHQRFGAPPLLLMGPFRDHRHKYKANDPGNTWIKFNGPPRSDYR